MVGALLRPPSGLSPLPAAYHARSLTGLDGLGKSSGGWGFRLETPRASCICANSTSPLLHPALASRGLPPGLPSQPSVGTQNPSLPASHPSLPTPLALHHCRCSRQSQSPSHRRSSRLLPSLCRVPSQESSPPRTPLRRCPVSLLAPRMSSDLHLHVPIRVLPPSHLGHEWRLWAAPPGLASAIAAESRGSSTQTLARPAPSAWLWPGSSLPLGLALTPPAVRSCPPGGTRGGT